jgi:methylenetetrahydrofolate dehydrogenase (NADP+)/methenyltetrahydrofolate cyclohydrolase
MENPSAEVPAPRRLDGRLTSKKVRSVVAREVEARPAGSPSPSLHLVRVGEDTASVVYVRNKAKACEEVGIRSAVHELPASATQADVLGLIRRLNEDPDVDGFLVQLPLPAQLDPVALQEAMDPGKDVDGLHPLNAGRLAQGRLFLVPCTPLGILALLSDYGIETAGKRAVVLGRSDIVGRPMAQLLSLRERDATVTMAHSKTKDLAAVTREAEILVVAIGRPRFVEAPMVRPGAVVIDVGIHRIDDPAKPKGRLVGDVEAEGVGRVASGLSPVPGGVGPMTVAFLLANTLWACQCRREWPRRTEPWRILDWQPGGAQA